jgi:hypothetical protein
MASIDKNCKTYNGWAPMVIQSIESRTNSTPAEKDIVYQYNGFTGNTGGWD